MAFHPATHTSPRGSLGHIATLHLRGRAHFGDSGTASPTPQDGSVPEHVEGECPAEPSIRTQVYCLVPMGTREAKGMR